MILKKIRTVLLSGIVTITSVLVTPVVVNAEEVVTENVDISYLMTDDALVGKMNINTFGIYLADGFSVINKAGTGKIGVGGTTTAARRCQVSVNAVVERLSNGSWYRVTNFSNTRYNEITAMVSSYVYVSTGYSYRTRSTHSANSDVGYSYTDALIM